MAVTLSHPFRLGADGRPATITQGTPRHAAEQAAHILACRPGERGLAPEWGLPDPVGQDLDEDLIAATITACEPDLDCRAVTIDGNPDGTVRIRVDVEWAERITADGA